MILQSACFSRFCHHQLRPAVNYIPLHHLMIMVSSALGGGDETAVVTTIAKGMS
jgi:hypothetical protein